MEQLPAVTNRRLSLNLGGRLARPHLTPRRAARRARGCSSSAPGSSALLFTLFLMIATFVFTFLNITLAQEEPLAFVGLDNYARLANDKQVWASLGVTLKFALLWLPVSVLVPFFIALGLNSRFVLGSHVFRALFFLPFVVPFVAGVLVWQQTLGDDGWFNTVLQFLGWADLPSWLFDAAGSIPRS